MLYVGVDAHSETSWITVMDEKGKVLKRREISSSRSFHGVLGVVLSQECYRKMLTNLFVPAPYGDFEELTSVR